MSHDDTDRLSADPPGPSTRDLVLQLLERTGRVEAALGVGEADTLPLSGRMNRLTAEVTEIKADLSQVKADLSQVKADLAQVKIDLGQVKADLAEVKVDLGQVKADLAEVKIDLAEFKTETLERLEDIDRELARLSRQDAGRWLRLEERVRVLEHPEEPKG
jgi:septal ring factor EnvC (AmiA/AmiB activator)